MTTTDTMTDTGIISKCSLDADLLSADLRTMDTFPYTDTYSEFVCGAWKSCAVWNGTGHGLDAGLDPYSGPATITDLGKRLPYVQQVVAEIFDVSRLKYARIARLTPESVLVPHRDYLELESDLIRIHLPLETHESCANSHETTIYHMNVGEIWFLDATQTHSAASGWNKDRTHLILDFHADELSDCLKDGVDKPTIPESNRILRMPVEQSHLDIFERSGVLMDRHNYRDFLKVAIKTMFVRDIAPGDVFTMLEGAAKHSSDPEVDDMVAPMRTYFLKHRVS